jgi:hypothetical protein
MLRLHLLAVLLIGAALAGTARPSGAEDETMRIVVAASALNTPASGSTLGASLGTITATVGEATCTTVDLMDGRNQLPNGEKLIEIGDARTQPGGCHSEGAIVRFYDGRGRELTIEYAFRAGATETLENLAPKPPGRARRGLLKGTVSVEGRGLLTGRSIASRNPFFLTAVPGGTRQPVELAIVEWAVVVDETGHFYRVLDPGDYWLAAPPRLPITNGDATITVRSSGTQEISVRAFQIQAGGATEVEMILSAHEFDNPPPTPVITDPIGVVPPGSRPSSSIVPPTSGDGGLR